jgi:hypothetical protein
MNEIYFLKTYKQVKEKNLYSKKEICFFTKPEYCQKLTQGLHKISDKTFLKIYTNRQIV